MARENESIIVGGPQLDQTANPELRFCPFMSNQFIMPVGNVSIPTNIQNLGSPSVPCMREKCAVAFVDRELGFLGCGLANVQELDRLQEHVGRITNMAVPVNGTANILVEIRDLNQTLKDLVSGLINRLERKLNVGERDANSIG